MNMKSFIILVAMVAAAVADTYDSTYDDLDVESIVSNPETMKSVTMCYLDEGPCSEVAAFYKKLLPEATATACEKCTAAQKHMLRRYLEELKETDPEDFEALKEKYDPEGEYSDALSAAIADA